MTSKIVVIKNLKSQKIFLKKLLQKILSINVKMSIPLLIYSKVNKYHMEEEESKRLNLLFLNLKMMINLIFLLRSFSNK